MLSRNLLRNLPRSSPRSLTTPTRTASTLHNLRQTPTRTATATATHTRTHQKQSHLYRSLLTIAIAGGLATLTTHYLLPPSARLLKTSQAESPNPERESAPLVLERSRKQAGLSREENRDLISSQHHQVKRSWENPGLYAWGSNSGRVVAPDRPAEAVIKSPRRIGWFDNKLLRDVKLDRNFGAAIDESGDLVQWGVGYKPNLSEPEITLKGKDLINLAISRDRILALSKSGKVFSLPVSSAEQISGPKPQESTWLPFWSSTSPLAYRDLTPKTLTYSERISALDSGLEHALLLTTSGRVFSAASATDRYPNRGQLGLPGLSWLTRPEGDFDQPHELTTLKGFPVAQLACGDYHSLVLDRDGRVFTWGDNASGQLGFEFSAENSVVDAPSLLPTQRLYSNSGSAQGATLVPKITSVAAGGANSYITVDATHTLSRRDEATLSERQKRLQGRVTADTFAFGTGIQGQLANNRWTHTQTSPTKIPSLSGLFEYDEKTFTTTPIRLASLSVGSTHAAAVMGNITNLSLDASSTPDSTNWGADIVFWGGNEFFQLGTGKRNNISSPTYLQPLDLEAEVKRARKSSAGKEKEEHRFHITPRARVLLGDGRRREVEQRVVCGRFCSGVFSAVCS